MSRYVSLANKLLRLPAKLFDRCRERGLLETCDWLLYQGTSRFREWRLGIQTGEFDGLQVGDEGDHHGYEPVEFRCFDLIMQRLAVRPGKDVFLDYGCGKGRAVVLAATYPYRRVLGLELSPELCEIARQQVKRAYNKLHCREVEILQADAALFPLPDDVNHVFLFNSFKGEVLQGTLEQVRQSLVRVPRTLSLVYMIPTDQDDPLAQLSWLEYRSEISTGFWNHIKCHYYEHKPSQDGDAV